MSDLPTNKSRAVDLIANVSANHLGLSPEQTTLLEEAVEHDLDTASEHAAHDEERLVTLEGQVRALSDAAAVHGQETVANKAIVDEQRLAHVEKQTRGLAEAVIAITETADTLAPAVKAVKDEMTDATPISVPRHLRPF